MSAPNPPIVPAPAAPVLGTKPAFLGLLAAFGLIVFGWQWRKAAAEDWAAGAAVFSLVPAILTVGVRWTFWRKVLAALSAAAALFCWSRFAFGEAVSAPSIEAGILVGLGACALFGGVYLGQWGQDRSEAIWARVLGPSAGAALLLSALTWTVPDSQPWSAALCARAGAWWATFNASGGLWRWLGTLAVWAAMGAAEGLKTPKDSAPKDRKLNWNRD
jgi:hypothetical protein